MKGKSVLPVLLLAVIWGTYYVASQQTVAGMSVFSMGVYIRLIVMGILTVLMAIRGQLKLLLQVRYVWPRLVAIGVLGFLLDATAFVGLSLGSASTGTALLKCDILMVAVISAVIYKTRLTWRQWACMVVMLLGVFVTMGLDPLTTKMEMVTVLTMDCHDREVIEYIGGLVPGVDLDAPYLTARDLDGVLAHASSEGRITMEPFTKTMVTRYESYSEAMPLFRECMRLVNKHSGGFFKDLLRE